MSVDRSATRGRWHEQKRGLGLTAVLCAVALGFEWLSTGRWLGAGDLHPHPYWIFVLPVAAAYGILNGLASAALASALYVLGLWLTKRPDSLRELLDRDVLAEPVLFTAAAIILGETRYGLSQRLSAAYADRRELAAELSREVEDRATLSIANTELTRRLAAEARGVRDVLELARRSRHATHSARLELAAAFLAERSNGFVRVVAPGANDLGLRVIALTGRARHAPLEPERSQLVKLAIARRAAVSAFAQPCGPGEPLGVAPVLDHERKITALLILDDVPLERLRAEVIDELGWVAEWLGAELGTRSEGALDAGAVAPPPDPPQRAAFLPSVLAFERARGSERGGAAHIIGIFAPQAAGLDETRVQRATVSAVGQTTGLFRFCYPGTYALIVPSVSSVAARGVATRIEQELLARAPRVLDVPRTYIHSVMDSGDEALVLGMLSAEFRAQSRQPLPTESFPGRESFRIQHVAGARALCRKAPRFRRRTRM